MGLPHSTGTLFTTIVLCAFLLCSTSTLAFAKPHSSQEKCLPASKDPIPDGIDVIRVNVQDKPSLYQRFTGYDIMDGAPSSSNPFVSNINDYAISYSTSNSKYEYALACDKSSYEESMAMQVDVEGSYMGFNTKASVGYATSSESESSTVQVSVFTRKDLTYLVLNETSADEIYNLLNDDAKKLLDSNPFAFMDKYGTHFVQSIHTSCQARLTGTYSFSSHSNQQEFKQSLSVSYTGLFSASTSESLDNAAKSTDSSSSLNVNYEGDTFGIAPADVGKLGEWAQVIFEKYDVKCNEAYKEGRVDIKAVNIRSWNDIIKSQSRIFPAPGVEDVLNIHTASYWQSVMAKGYQALHDMAARYINPQHPDILRPFYLANISQLTNVIEVCPDPADPSWDPVYFTGPNRTVTSYTDLKEAILRHEWTDEQFCPSHATPIEVALCATQFKDFMLLEVKRYVILLHQTTMKYQLVAGSKNLVADVIASGEIDIFKGPVTAGHYHYTCDGTPEVDQEARISFDPNSYPYTVECQEYDPPYPPQSCTANVDVDDRGTDKYSQLVETCGLVMYSTIIPYPNQDDRDALEYLPCGYIPF